MDPRTPVLERLQSNIQPDPILGCWWWNGTTERRGYGYMNVGNGHRRVVHRVVFETLVGPIPDGMQLDHLCHNRACVNPAHLRVATQRQNQSNRKGKRDGKYSSHYTGVSYEQPRRGRGGGVWRAFIADDNQRRALGSFEDEESAHRAYVLALETVSP